MAVLNPGIDKISIGSNYSYSLPMILTYTVDDSDNDKIHLKIHLNKSLKLLQNNLPNGVLSFWIERGGRKRSTNQSGARGNRHLSKIGKFRAKTWVCDFTKQSLNSLIENDSVPEVLISIEDYKFEPSFYQTYICVRASIRGESGGGYHHPGTGINSNEIKIEI